MATQAIKITNKKYLLVIYFMINYLASCIIFLKMIRIFYIHGLALLLQ
jgi:hypothetical protein